MSNNQKLWAGLLLGAAAGAAVTFFLGSDKGKEILADAKESVEKFSEDLKAKLQTLNKEVDSLVERGKTIAEEIENKVAESIV